MRSSRFALCALALSLAACVENPLVSRPNMPPKAAASVIGPDGKTVLLPNSSLPAHDVKFDYMGSDITFTLDASGSTDEDGTIVKWQWFSGTPVPDGGVGPLSTDVSEPTMADPGKTVHKMGGGRWVPAGQSPDWPADTKQVQLTLGEGVWSFVLWVTDNGKKTSEPDTITITIKAAGDPVADCVADVLPMIKDSCKTCICMQSDSCRANVVQSKCDANCWGLIQCIATMCPTFTMNPSDTSCVVGMCGMFLSGAMGAMGAGMCIAPCASSCM